MMSEYVSDHYTGIKGKNYVANRQDVLNHLGFRLQSRFYLPYLEAKDYVLDFGCGSGSLAMALKANVGRIVGLEVNEHSRRLAEGQGLETFASLDEIPRNEMFSKIVSNHVLEHVPNVFGTLVRLRNHLTESGRLVAMVPIEDFRARRNQEWTESDYDRHLYTWAPLQFGNLLSEAGYIPLFTKIVTSAWSPKLFFLGDGQLQRAAGVAIAILKRRRQLLAVAARRP